MDLTRRKPAVFTHFDRRLFEACVRCVVAGVLVTAASLKAAQLYGEGGLNEIVTNLVAGFQVALEIALALLIIAPFWRTASWSMSLLCFATFAAISLTKALRGDTSCGCFGVAEISPWSTFTLDVSIVILLVFTGSSLRTSQDYSVPISARWSHFAFSFCVACVGWLLVSALSTGQLSPRQRRFDPEEWIGRRLPLLADVDIGRVLASGEWEVVLFRHDCPDCESLLASERRFPKVPPDGRRVAFISIPPHDRFVSDELQSAGRIVGELSDRNGWAVTTPLVISLRNGIVGAIDRERSGEIFGSPEASSSVVYADFGEREEKPANETLNSELASLLRTNQDCGVQCLYVVSRILGNTKDFSWFKDRISTIGTGASMLDLKTTASEAGLTVEAVRASLGDVKALWNDTGSVAILHVDDTHYVAILGFTENEVRLFDPSCGIRSLNVTEFADRYLWSGIALVLRSPVAGGSRI
jgi:hypothetical protein